MNSPSSHIRTVYELPRHSTVPLSGTLYLTAVPPVKFAATPRGLLNTLSTRTSVCRLPHTLQVQIVCTERHAYSNSLAHTGGIHSKHFPSSDISRAPAGFRPKGCSRKSAQAVEEYGNLLV